MTYYIDSFFKNFANFSGRCSRKYFWIVFLTTLFILAISFLPYYFLKDTDFLNLLSLLFVAIILLINFIPLVSLFFRRVHDVDYSFWNLLIPFYNLYILYLMFLVEGTSGANTYGDPYPELE